MLGFNFESKTKPTVYNNVDSYFDIPTANLVIGAKKETILNGGLGKIFAIVGSGNNYKSTILHDMMLSAADKVMATTDTAMATYDTEVNVSTDRLDQLASKYEYIPKNPITDAGIWSVTDKSIMSANAWVLSINAYIKNKIGSAKSMVTYTALTDPYTKEPLRICAPTFVEIDSLSELEGEGSTTMLEGDLEDSGTNTFAMRQGMFKHKFLSQLPRLSGSSNTVFLMTAHIGKKIDMATGPAKYQQPSKQLQYLKAGDVLKGVTNKFNYLVNGGALFAHTASKLLNQGTKLPEYPMDSSADDPNELNIVRLTQLRGKNGTSGYTLDVLVSQYTGVLFDLTKFHYIKSKGRYGLVGSAHNYELVMYPGTKLSRSTVRAKIDNDAKLAKAIQFTSDLLQLHTFHRHLDDVGLLCTPEELYEDIKKLGYDWNVLLDTRSWLTVDQYSDKVKPFLSIVDLLKMRKELYKPYWLKG
ncbi:MAG: hypothetical protein Q9M11_03640 [Mariprofundaceae bacterium]|nr:hypothetical protein [Mariprofundaceae bacterium]